MKNGCNNKKQHFKKSLKKALNLLTKNYKHNWEKKAPSSSEGGSSDEVSITRGVACFAMCSK